MMEQMRKRFSQNKEFFPEPPPDPRFVTKVPVLTTFESRKACSAAGVHRPSVAGIDRGTGDGAFSICMSGGYDDKDHGDFIVYTGTGGQSDTYSGRGTQIEDQTFEHRDNAALLKSIETKRPVRVVRGANSRSVYAPESGYRYDGLYTVTKASMSKGQSGYDVCTYELRRLPDQPPLPQRNTKKRL